MMEEFLIWVLPLVLGSFGVTLLYITKITVIGAPTSWDVCLNFYFN